MIDALVILYIFLFSVFQEAEGENDAKWSKKGWLQSKKVLKQFLGRTRRCVKMVDWLLLYTAKV